MKHLHARRAFTLIELLVVMGIIAVLAGVTVLGYRGIAKDAKLSSAKNAVMAALDNARGLAMKNNEIVCVVFRARLDGNKQYLEAVTGKYSRQSSIVTINNGADTPQAIDRFAPIPGIPPRRLPAGVKIAGPYYTAGSDEQWVTNSHLPLINQSGQFAGDGEAPGRLLGVMYSPDGRVITSNAHTDSYRSWVDFDNDGIQRWGPIQSEWTNYSMPPVNMCNNNLTEPVNLNPPYCIGLRWQQRLEHDEPYINFMPFLAIFDDDVLREVADVTRWKTDASNGYDARRWDYSVYIGGYPIGQFDPRLPRGVADRIHFNQYTGVVMK